MTSQGTDCESILKVIQDKFNESFKYFMGNGSLASTMYIDSQVHSVREQKTKSFDELCDDFLSNDSISRSNLILGDSGLGKTTLGLHICQKFWEHHDHSKIDFEIDRFPIYIHLPSVVKTLKKNILFRFLGKNSALVDSVAKLKLLLILDGFDEFSDRNENIFKINRWGYPPHRDVRVVILSRHEIPQSHKTGLFEFIRDGEPPPSATSDSCLYSEHVIQPFNSEQINGYIDCFDNFILSKDETELSGSVWEMTKLEYIHRGWSKADYLKWFERFRDLRLLAQSPLILSLIMQTLPKVCRGGIDMRSDEKDVLKNIEKFCKTKASVFDTFTEYWFYFQFKRLVKARRLKDFRIHWLVFQEFCYAFGQNVAYCMISRRRDESRGLLQNNVSSNQILHKKLLEVNGNDYSVSREIQSECTEILKSSENIPELLEAVRIACLIKCSEINLNKNETTFLVSFFHRSLAEYFVSRDLFMGLAGEFDFFLTEAVNENFIEDKSVRGLNSYLLKEEGIIMNLADRLKHESDLKNTLFSIIHESRNVSLISIMSANAISILNIGGISLSGLDFSWVQIPGANLNHSICGNTNFNGANLLNVSFENAWLFGAQFKGANLEGTRFGLVRNISIENVRYIEICQENESWFLYGGNACERSGCLKILKWDLLNLETVKEFKTTCSQETTDIGFGFNFLNEKYLFVWRESLILFELESGQELAREGLASVGDTECEFPVILGLTSNRLYTTWANVLQIYDVHLNLQGSRHVLQLISKQRYTFDVSTIVPILNVVFRRDSRFNRPNAIDFLLNVDFGLVVVFGDVLQFMDKGISINLDGLIIKAFDIDSRKSQIVIAIHLGFMEVWSLVRKIRLKKLTYSCGFIRTLTFSKCFKYLVTGAIDNWYDNSVTIWDNENDWSILNIIRVGKDIPFPLRTWTTNCGQTTLAIPLSGSLQLYTITENETNDQIQNKMITQKKLSATHLEWISCSPDGHFFATISRAWQAEKQEKNMHRFSNLGIKSLSAQGLLDSPPSTPKDIIEFKSILKRALKLAYPVEPYTIQIHSAVHGTKIYEIKIEICTELLHMTFIVNNRILCIQKTEEGTTFCVIYDLNGQILNNSADMNLPNCGISSTQLNRDGTLIAFVLRNGEIRLFKLLTGDPYIQRWGCIPSSTIDINFKPRYVNFNSGGTFLATVCLHHLPDDRPMYNNAQVQIWNVRKDSMILISKFTQSSLSLPASILCPGGLISFDLNKLSSHQEELSLFAHVKMPNDKDSNIVIISKMQQRVINDIFEITFWFKIKFLNFIPKHVMESTSAKLIVSDQFNVCCLEMCFNEPSHPTWSVLWAFCSNLYLVVNELSLNGCISMNESIFHNLIRLGAHSDGWMACSSQEYISKSNLICPILGSSDLGHSSILSSDMNECLSPSNDNWILSVIGKKTGHTFLNVQVNVVSHVPGNTLRRIELSF